MVFIVINPSQVEKNGINYGKVGDAIANNKNDASEIQLALEVWGNELTQQVADVPGLRSRISQLEQELEAYRNPPQREKDYAGLYNALIGEQGISLFLFIRYVAGEDKYVNLAYTDTMSALTFGAIAAPPTDTQLQSCVEVLFGSMLRAGSGFSDPQIALMRSLLDQNGFQEIQFPVGV